MAERNSQVESGIGAPHGAHALADALPQEGVEAGHPALADGSWFGGMPLPELDVWVRNILEDFHGHT